MYVGDSLMIYLYRFDQVVFLYMLILHSSVWRSFCRFLHPLNVLCVHRTLRFSTSTVHLHKFFIVKGTIPANVVRDLLSKIAHIILSIVCCKYLKSKNIWKAFYLVRLNCCLLKRS